MEEEIQLVCIAQVLCRLAPVASGGMRMPVFRGHVSVEPVGILLKEVRRRYGDWFNWFAHRPERADAASQSL